MRLASLTILSLVLLSLLSAACSRHRRRCRVVPLPRRRSVRAGVVFAGRVRSLFVRSRSLGLEEELEAFAARVEVGEIFRGKEFLVTDHDDGLDQNLTAIVEGLSNPRICVSRPRIGQERIFFANPVDAVTVSRSSSSSSSSSSRHIRLRSSLLRPTRENLDILRSIRDGRTAGAPFAEEGEC